MSDRWSGCQRLLVSAVLMIPLGLGSRADETVAGSAKPVVASQSVQAALHEIFADEHCQESALSICQRAEKLDAAEQYESLFRQVFPATAPEAIDVPTVRIVVDFTPTDPAPPISGPIPPKGVRLESGGQLVSPAIDLFKAAEKSGKLDPLLNHLQSLPCNNLLAQKNRAALLVMLYAKQSNHEKILTELDQFIKLSSLQQPDDQIFRASELTLGEICRRVPGTGEVLLGAVENIVNRQKRGYSSLPWFRQFRSQQAMIAALAATSEKTLSEQETLWTSAGAMSSFTRGAGIPASRWEQSPGIAHNTVSHGDDYLYFRIPMRGEFQIECDVSAFNWTETRPFVAGQWVSPIYDHQNFDLGNIRVSHPRRSFAPPLTRINDSFHMRAFVEQQRITTTANGRVVHQHDLPAQHDPWVAMRSGAMQEGWASNVRVTGNPEIPDTIDMAATAELESWLPYCDGSVGGHWLPRDGGGIIGQRVLSSNIVDAGTNSTTGPEFFREEAIFYHRPMLEDGTIEYDFFYLEGQRNAHPVIDRLCLMIKPDGVRVHWLTDGKYDRSELLPDNETIEPQNRLTGGRIPLNNNEWNTLQLALRGDVVEVKLNSELIYRRELESTNQRRFGFFHYADHEELLVRNVRWTGSWPKNLPGISEQALAVPEAEFLEQNIGHLSAEFRHNFVADGLSDENMTLIQGAMKTNFNNSTEGVASVIVGTGGYKSATLAPQISVEGDFDIIAEYSNFQSQPSFKGSSSLLLVAFLNNAANDEYYVTRRHMSHTAENQQQIVQCVAVGKVGESVRREYFVTRTVEERSGRLRLSRRGAKMYYLSAEGNSPNFRLLGSRDCAKDPVQLDGIRLVNQIHEVGQTEVVWKDLTVRAERLTGPALGEADARLITLNNEREALPARMVYDFVHAAPTESALYRWGDLRPWSEEEKGLPILAAGTTNWTSSGITTQQPIVGDFDVRVNFDQVQLITPQKGQGSGVFFQVDLSDEKRTQISAIFNRTEVGNYEFDSQIRTNDAEGKPTYRNSGRRAATTASSLRIARRGTTVTILSQANRDDDERLVAQFQASDAAVSGAKLLVHTGGPVGDSQVKLKSMDIRADFYAPLLIEPVTPVENSDRLFVMKSDGTNLRALTAPQPQFGSQGSPDWSPDGSLIAFDTWAGQAANSRIVIVHPDGTGMQDLGEGVLPDFSPDSRRIALSWAGRGLTIMNRDGSDRKVINADGWGARWSPNGRWLACAMNKEANAARSGNVAIIDIASGEVRFMLSGPHATRYTNIFSNFEWSPDSKWLCFKGRTAEQNEEIAIVGVPEASGVFEKPSIRPEQSSLLRVISTGALVYDFAWHPNGRIILLSLLRPNENRLELQKCDIVTGTVQPFMRQPLERSIRTLSFSPDGKEIVFSSGL